MECPGEIRRIVRAELASWLSARNADRFERFTIKPPDLPDVSDFAREIQLTQVRYWRPYGL